MTITYHPSPTTDSILAAIDGRLAILHQARLLLADSLPQPTPVAPPFDRLPGIVIPIAVPRPARRQISPAARERISQAQHRRWRKFRQDQEQKAERQAERVRQAKRVRVKATAS